MHKRDYIALADAIDRIPFRWIHRQFIAEWFADQVLVKDNPAFDREKFLRAAAKRYNETGK